MGFENKIAIVTWGGAGIGEALCRELARRGARVVVADINGDDADRVTTSLAGDGGRAESTWPTSRMSGGWSRRPPPRTGVWTTCSTTRASRSGVTPGT